jgi:predicted TIM-barrel fold metal-dependent hydrolase
MKTITVEEHFASPGFIAGAGREFRDEAAGRGPRGVKIFEQLSDVGAGRLAEMDAAGIDFQLLSINYPGTEQLDAAEAIPAAREINDFLAAAVKKHPTRFAGLAVLPTAVPDKAAEELQRRIGEGFKGAVINGHNRGRYLDDKFYWPIFERAEALDVNNTLSAAGWGWHIETSVHIIRLILGGVFDRYPKLQIAIGHLGEGLPFMLPRLDRNLPPAMTKLQRSLGDYLRQNIHYTFGGFNFPATFLDLLLEVGVDRIMFSADYPYGSMAAARAFLEQIPVSAADRERIAHGNAEKLFRV